MRYRREFELAGPVAEAFAYLADFDNAKEWDPGVERSTRLTPPPESVVCLTGVWRLAEPFLRPTLKRESDRALERMAEEFERHVQGPR
jgi:hypothetical protein